MKRRMGLVLILSLLVLLTGCAGLGGIFEERRPKVSVEGVRIAGFDFQGIELRFDLKVDNPNPVGITLGGLDYDFRLQGSSFLKGEQPLGLKLAAKASSQVEVPFKLGYRQLKESYQALASSNMAEYELLLGLGFDVPALGRVRIPVEYEDKIPLPRLPQVSLDSIGFNGIGSRGDRLELSVNLQVENPNDFALLLDQLAYTLELDGRQVGGVRLNDRWEIRENGKGVLRLPISLDFLKLGNALYSLLLNGGSLDYHLIGAMAGASTDPQFGRFNLPLEQSGTTNLVK